MGKLEFKIILYIVEIVSLGLSVLKTFLRQQELE